MELDKCWDHVTLSQNDKHDSVNENTIEDENKIKTFRVKNYIPKRFTKTFLDLPHIIGIAIVFTLIITIIVLLSLKNKNAISEENTDIPGNASTEIILLDGKRFWTFDTQKGSYKLLLEVKKSPQVFCVDAEKTLFWIETNSWKVFSLHQFKSGTEKNINLVFEGTGTKLLRKPAIAVDSINNNLYIVDESIQGLVIINTDTKYYALMLIDLVNPRFIVLDEVKGIMFISSEKWIKRADMDGNNLSTIVVNKAISAVTLDYEGEKVYWVHNSEVIKSSDYNGKQEQHLLTDFMSIVDLTFLNHHLFWLRKSKGIQNKVIWSCKILNGTCGNHTKHFNTASTATFMRVASRAHNNSGYQNFSNHCEHISLATQNGQRSCVCNMSSQLIFNTKCEPITEFILYTFNGDIRARTLDISQKIVLEPIWPTPYITQNLSVKPNIDFDYDFENDDFYFSDDKKIYKIKLKAKNPKQEVVLTINITDEFYIKDLAYDWLTGNMYYLKLSTLDSVIRHSVQVFNVKIGVRKTIKYFDSYNSLCSINFDVIPYSPYALAMCPNRGILFLATGSAVDSYNSNMYLNHLMMNGTLNTQFSEDITIDCNAERIAVDCEEDRIYWISLNNEWFHSNFYGAEKTIISSRESNGLVKSISLNRQWIYVSNHEKIWRVNKETGDYDNLIVPFRNYASTDAGAKVISQTQVEENPCRINNGGCEQFCFSGSEASCGCADELIVTSKGQCT